MEPLPPIILASSSPYRRELLARLGLPFESRNPAVDETPGDAESAAELVERLAIAKARAVAIDIEHGLVIGSDQVAAHDGRIVGKPADRADAVRQLREASGRTVVLYTGLALVNTASGRLHSGVEAFHVTFRELSDRAIERYVDDAQPFDCCGSLRAEGSGIWLLESLRGNDPSALIGLPLIRLCEMLASEGVTRY